MTNKHTKKFDANPFTALLFFAYFKILISDYVILILHAI